MTISCNYSGNDIRSCQWYRQYPNSAPEFLLQTLETLGPEQKDRHVAKAQKAKKHLTLEISKAEVEDAAVYYCALVHSNRKPFNPVQKPERMNITLFTSLANIKKKIMISEYQNYF